MAGHRFPVFYVKLLTIVNVLLTIEGCFSPDKNIDCVYFHPSPTNTPTIHPAHGHKRLFLWLIYCWWQRNYRITSSIFGIFPAICLSHWFNSINFLIVMLIHVWYSFWYIIFSLVCTMKKINTFTDVGRTYIDELMFHTENIMLIVAVS